MLAAFHVRIRSNRGGQGIGVHHLPLPAVMPWSQSCTDQVSAPKSGKPHAKEEGRNACGLPVLPVIVMALAEARAKAEADHGRRRIIPRCVVAIGAVVRLPAVVPVAMTPVAPPVTMARTHVGGLICISRHLG